MITEPIPPIGEAEDEDPPLDEPVVEGLAAAEPPAREPEGAQPTPGETQIAEPQIAEPEAVTRLTAARPRQPVLPTDSWAEAGRKVVAIQVERLLTLDTELRSPDAVDQLRRYRVATRRLRAALRLFGSATAGHDAARLKRDLGQLARAVGGVRDLDVRLADLEAWASRRDAGADRVRPLAEAWRSERAEGHRRLLAELESRHHGRLLERLVQLTVEDPADAHRGEPTTTERVVDRGGSALWRGLELVLAFGPDLPSAGILELHALRIEAKRLRYALEFLRDALDPRSALLVARLVALQDRLGAMNDAAATARAVAQFIGKSGDDLGDRERRAIIQYQSAALGRLTQARRRVPAAWRPIGSQTFGRRLATVVAALAAPGAVHPAAAPVPGAAAPGGSASPATAPGATTSPADGERAAESPPSA